MSRITDAIITGAYTRDLDRPILNLEYGGQHGWAPNLTELVNNQAYVSRPLICLVLEVPRMFTVMPDSQKWIASFKALHELHAKSIDGFNAGLKVDTTGHPVGGGGEEMDEPTNVTRERSVPRFTFISKYGRPEQLMLDYWIRYGIMDPETKYALISTLGESTVEDLLADWYSATMIFIEPDAMHKRVDKAWLTTGMFPKLTGDIAAKRDLTSAQDILTLDIEYTGVSSVGLGVNRFAQQLLDGIRIDNADPYMRPAFVDSISADVADTGNGSYKNWLETIGRTSVTNMSR